MRQNRLYHPDTSRRKQGRGRSFAVLLSTGYGLLAMGLFSSGLRLGALRLSGIATVSFMFLVPFAMGLIASCCRSVRPGPQKLLRASLPLVPVLALFAISVLLQRGMLLYALVAFPVYASMSLIGGVTGAYIFPRRKALIYAGVLMPFVICPIEHLIGPAEEIYSETAAITIGSGAQPVWQNTVKVEAIAGKDTNGPWDRFPVLPQPVKAAFDTIAVGGTRKALFDRGLVFTEKITAVVPRQYLAFDIKADPASRTHSALERSIIIDGAYFSVISGAFRLEPMGDNRTRLLLTTRYRLSTHFNPYGRFWAGMVLSRVQAEILQLIRARSEQEL